jgi:hypothetical protein
MASIFHASSLFSVLPCVILLLSALASANDSDLELLPLNKHGRRTDFRKRMENSLDDDLSGMDLMNFGTFLWGAEGKLYRAA